jgi:hypothetical protein
MSVVVPIAPFMPRPYLPWGAFLGIALGCSSEGARSVPRDGSPGDGGRIPMITDCADDRGGADATTTDSGDELPMLLSETGLYDDIATETLADGVRPYRPRFELWSDGAEKRRWLFLPTGASIDSSDADGWVFPVGTNAWKEFVRDGVRVETRLFRKVGPGRDGWRFVSYVWDADQTDARRTPEGARNAGGTPHDVPNESDCFACHAGSPDMLLGVSTLQLAHETSGLTPPERGVLGLTLEDLATDGALTTAPSAFVLALPGQAVEQRALSTLHVDCGHCHRPGTLPWERAEMDLHLDPSALGSLGTTGVYRTAVGAATQRAFDGIVARVNPGRPEQSAVYERMSTRDVLLAMPPIATEDVDAVGSQAVFDWIAAMEPVENDAGARDGSAPGDGGAP